MNGKSCYAIQNQSLEEESYSVPNINKFKTDDNTQFFHYTTVKAAIEILTSNESESNNGNFGLWASQQQFLNDDKEMSNGLDLIKEYFQRNSGDIIQRLSDVAGADKKGLIDKFIKQIETYQDKITADQDIYIVCFCTDGDLLSQWKYYGRNSGVAIEFDLKGLRYSGLDATDKKLDPPRKYPVGPYRVIYSDDDKKQIIKDIVDNAVSDYSNNLEDKDRLILGLWEQLFAISPLFKHKNFSEEAECRLLFRPVFTEDCNTRDIIHYRERNGIPLPYMKITLHPQKNNSCIKSIRIGPGSNQALVVKAFKHLLERKGLSESIKLYHSETPFRGL